MTDHSCLCLPVEQLPPNNDWLEQQPHPVIAMGKGQSEQADVIVSSHEEADRLVARIERTPIAAMTLVQVLRAIEHLPVQSAMSIESLGYASLQSGPEHQQWLAGRQEAPQLITASEGEPIRMKRTGNTVQAQLNRPEHRNTLTVEMRDALVELFELLLIDTDIERLELSGRGDCFSAGGELREFGLTPGPAVAHQIRSIHNPGRLLARIAGRVHCHLHSACIGSGIELPAFAAHISADSSAFFQLPELKFGLIPGAGGCVSIARRIGRQRTAWLALSGRKINAQQALEWGLVDAIVPS